MPCRRSPYGTAGFLDGWNLSGMVALLRDSLFFCWGDGDVGADGSLAVGLMSEVPGAFRQRWPAH